MGRTNRPNQEPTLAKLILGQTPMSTVWMLERLRRKKDWEVAMLRQHLQWGLRIEVFIPLF